MIRILFVDDEINVLQAMQRALRPMRGEWHMQFALSGADALQLLQESPTDVLVTDMRMPGMDGWQLLEEVKRAYPETVRLVLSGDADPPSILRTVGTAHQYLAKPCDSATLKAAIAETYALRQLLNSDRLAKLVGNVGLLPSAPQAFQEMLLCLQGPSASISDASKIVARDVAMTANVIKLVNSAFFGARQAVTTAERAVAHLGLDTLGALVLAHGIYMNQDANAMDALSFEALFQHSLEVATAARAIASHEKLAPARADEAFLAGMLHDIGKVIFATNPLRMPNGCIASTAEASLQTQENHAEVGAYLLGLWGFPSPILEAVARHHTPHRVEAGVLSLAQLVYIADHLVHQRRANRTTIDHELDSKFLEGIDVAARWPYWKASIEFRESRTQPA